jgi:alpha-1,6-mannosyltransferase
MTKRLLFGLGLLTLIPYVAAYRLADLRRSTIGFEIIFFAAFALYAGVTVLALRSLRSETFSKRALAAAFALAAIMQGVLILTPPTLSDDMYRYVWDGRVQAQGISPYRYPPDAPELKDLRDQGVWQSVNRKSAVTVYPPAAELVYAALWRIWPDNVRWFQAAMAAGGLAAGVLLVGLLRAAALSPARVLIYLWSPLLAFETAHSAHVDGLVLPLLVGAWWARLRERDGLVGILLGLATAVKIYPIILLPALWRPRHPRGRWRLPLAFALTVTACYLPYVVASGPQVLGYLPHYFGERFNMGLAGLLIPIFMSLRADPNLGMFILTFITLAALSVWLVLRPAPDALTAVRRCVWLMGAFTLLAQDLFAWYMLWLLPLIALFLQPGRWLGLRADAWSGWWLFCGLVALSYTFFIKWQPLPAATWAQFLPLYALLVVDRLRRSFNLRRWIAHSGLQRAG